MSPFPSLRVRQANREPISTQGDYVLYWMIAHRRTTWNFSLQRAADWARELRKPLLIFEPLRLGYRWASDRIHRFIMDGMADNARALEKHAGQGVAYYPYVEPAPDADKGLLAALASQACVVVTDEFPCFFLPRMVNAVARSLSVSLEVVDTNGLLPLRAAEHVFTTAFSFRSYLQKNLRPHLAEFPRENPLDGLKLPPLNGLDEQIARRWPAASKELLAGQGSELTKLAIDHSVGVAPFQGGSTPARRRLCGFLTSHLADYAEGANEPDVDSRSGLSPYLHFGHVSPFEMFTELARVESWNPSKLADKGGGKRHRWWGMSPGAEGWLDEFITWREIGYNMTSHREDYDRYESLPDWAQATLAKHVKDKRAFVYSLDEFREAKTHDPLWNAAQRQLLQEGRIHNYLRMLWGKKILEWSTTPRDALDVMIELNNRYAVDGRNPNSYSGIFWCLGRYDRPWGPERPIFGTVRYMSSENTARKMSVKGYLERFGDRSASLF